MKSKLIKYFIVVFALTFTLTSCDKDEQINLELANNEKGYTVENGYIKFKSIQDYKDLYEKLSTASELELNAWNENLPFKSLEAKYKDDKVESYVCDNNISDDINYHLNTKRLNATLASMYNENGVLVINDTILKIKDEYLYTIVNGDFSLIDKIESNNLDNTDFVTKEKHTVIVDPVNVDGVEGLQKTISDRTLVFYTSSTEREHVTFEAFLSGGYIRFEMKGQHQNKVVFWLPPVEDELIYGKIDASGTYGNAGYSTNNPVLYNEKMIYLQQYVGMPAGIPFALNVTYTYKKTNSTAYLHDWKGTSTTTAGTFTKYYTWQQF